MGARLGLVLGLALAACVLGAAPASAHALPQTSNPAAGSSVRPAPSTVTVVFGEAPDVRLSRLRVLDTGGQDHAQGATHGIPGQPRTLQVAVGPLTNGVYTVSWRTVSRVDGHLAAGTFAFGVGVAPTGGSGFSNRAPRPTATSVAARWLFYAGAMLLVGMSVFSVVCLASAPRRIHRLLATGWVLAAVGVAGIGLEAWHRAGFALADLLGSSVGHQLLARAEPLVLAGVAIVAARRWPRLIAVVALAGLAVMWGDVVASHASAARSWRYARMAVQAAHFGAAGVWVGGLVALAATVGELSPEVRSRAARRFSTIALVAVGIIGLSGAQRAYDEIGSIHQLAASSFGQSVLVKSALFVLLVGLGAVNRYVALPSIRETSRKLRVGVRAELGLIAAVLVATGILQGLAPPTSVAAPARPLVLSAHDFATTVKVRLSITPAEAGFNQFTLKVADYDTGRPVVAKVSLRFSLPARPDLGSSTLPLVAASSGVYSASGANLSIDGTWTVTAVIQSATSGVEIPFTVATRAPPQKITVQHFAGGLPDLYTLTASAGRSLQSYLDPGRPGFNEFHATYIGADGNEIAMTAAAVTARGPGNVTPTGLTVRRLDQVGHFVADLPGAVKGTYRFDTEGTTATGDQIRGTFSIAVK